LLDTKILLVEDDEVAALSLSEFLVSCGFEVKSVFCATDGISNMSNFEFDIVLLDLNLPDFSGFEVLKVLKNKHNVPVIVISAFSDLNSKLKAFKFGASDYMVKPFDLEELEARIWVNLSKNSQINLKEDSEAFKIIGSQIYFKNSMLDLTISEFKILKLLIKNKQRVTSREELGRVIYDKSGRAIDNHIKNIRKKIKKITNRECIKAIYGVGYLFKEDL